MFGVETTVVSAQYERKHKMANDTNWEAQLDWSKIGPVGGIGFCSFIKGSVLKSMDERLGQLVAIKEDKERTLGSWDEIAKVAHRLNDDFHKIVDAEIFKNTIRKVDERGSMTFPAGSTMTILHWLEFGQVFTETLSQGCRIPDDLKKGVAKTAGDIAKAESLRDFLKGYIEVGKIKEMAARTQKTMRLAKKAIERVGDRFWMDAEPLPKMV